MKKRYRRIEPRNCIVRPPSEEDAMALDELMSIANGEMSVEEFWDKNGISIDPDTLRVTVSVSQEK